MPLHPIVALDHIIEEYKDHLLTKFRAKDPKFLNALQREVNRDLFPGSRAFLHNLSFAIGHRWCIHMQTVTWM